MDTTNIFVAALPHQDIQHKIIETIKKSKRPFDNQIAIRWERPNDLHITLGYLRGIKTSDISLVLPHFEVLSRYSSIEATVQGAVVYGSALCLQLLPLEPFETLHQKLDEALEQSCHGIYEFNSHNHFDAHMTVGRIQASKENPINPKEKDKWIKWLSTTFDEFSFKVQDVAVLHRAPSQSANYQTLKSFSLKEL